MASEEEGREDWEVRLDDLVAQWEDEVAPAQVDDLVGQVEQIVASGSPAALAALTVPTSSATDLLAAAMFDQAEAAGIRTAADALVQGVTIDAVDPDTDPQLAADLTNAASVATAFLGQNFAVSAGREALRNWAPTSTADEVGESVRTHLNALTAATLLAELGGQIWAAENEGRSATLEAAIKAGKKPSHYVADEIRDSNTCSPCKAVDGEKFTTLASVQGAYPFGGYKKCDGRSRCRGTYWAVWVRTS